MRPGGYVTLIEFLTHEYVKPQGGWKSYFGHLHRIVYPTGSGPYDFSSQLMFIRELREAVMCAPQHGLPESDRLNFPKSLHGTTR